MFFGLRGRKQKAVLWPRIGTDKNGPTVDSTAVPLDVRWDGSSKVSRLPDGSPITIDATVIVDRDIAIGSKMWQGDVAELNAGQIPPRDVFQVVMFNSTPTVKGRRVYREVQLVRSRDTL
jgi:hypothetical protein